MDLRRYANWKNKALGLALALAILIAPASSHAQFFLNDVIAGANGDIRSMNLNLRAYDRELTKLKHEYQQQGNGATEAQKRKWLRKMKRLYDQRCVMNNLITKRLNPGIRAVNKMPKAIVDDGVQMINDEAQQQADQEIDEATGKVKAHPYYGKYAPKAKGILQDVKIAQGELKKAACPGPVIAKAIANSFADMANVPKIFFKVMCLPPLPDVNLMKKLVVKVVEKVLSPICFDAPFLDALPSLPRLPKIPQLKLNPLPNLDIPLIPALPNFPGTDFTNLNMVSMIPNLPSIPRIPTLKPVSYKLPSFPIPPKFGFSVNFGCLTVNGQAGPDDFTATGNQETVNETIKEMQDSGEWPKPKK